VNIGFCQIKATFSFWLAAVAQGAFEGCVHNAPGDCIIKETIFLGKGARGQVVPNNI
jgi:hypothetical protein